MNMQVGTTVQEDIVISFADCATMWGNDGLLALSTPAMLGYMEHACVKALQAYLSENLMTVGGSVILYHLAPTPANTQVHIQVELRKVTGKHLSFAFEVYDEQEKVGEGTHERYIVDKARFEERLQRKRITSENL